MFLVPQIGKAKVFLSFHPVPSGSSATERRRTDWLKKIDRKDWDDKTTWPDELISKQRVCSAHFLSGQLFLYVFKSKM